MTCIGGRACVPSEKPSEDQACNSRPCLSVDDIDLSSSSDDVTPRTPTNSNHVALFTTSVDDVMIVASSATIATATSAKTSGVIQGSSAIPYTTTATTTATTTTTRAAATTTTTTTATRTSQATTPLTSYRWMALFWDQVLIPFTLIHCI